ACGEKDDPTPDPDDTTSTRHVDRRPKDGKCDNCGADMGGTTPDDPDDPDQPDGPGAAQFFQGLWDSAASIGSEEISSKDDIALDLGLNLAIGKDGDNLLDLGIELGIVLDRTNDGANSAAKVKLYNHDDMDNWLTLYFFLNDPYYIYADWADQSLKIGVDFGFNQDWAATINDVVGMELIGGMSITELLESIIDGFGDDWNLDGLINSLTGLLGLNLGELLKSDTVAGILPMINPILGSLAENMGIEDFEGIDVDALAESDSIVLDLLKGVGPVLFPIVEVDEDTHTYKAGLDFGPNGLLGAVSSLLTGLPMGLGDVLQNLNEVAFEYQTDADGAIDNFAILVGVNTDDEPLSIEIGFNEVSITGVDAADNTFGIDKKDYEDEFNFNLALDLELTEGALVLYGNDLAGDFRLELNGMVDLVNVENNNTAAELVLTDGDKQLGRVTYADGTLALELDATDKNVKLALAELLPMAVNALASSEDANLQAAAVAVANAVYTTDFADADAVKTAYATKHNGGTSAFVVDTNFKGVALTGVELVNLFTGLFGGTPSFDAAADREVTSWSPSIMSILSLVSEVFDGNLKDGLTLTVEGVGDTIASLFADGNGPQSNEEFCYGDGKGIVGVFEAITGEKFEYAEDGVTVTKHTIESSDRGAGAEEWFAGIVGGSDWAEEGKVIASVFESDVTITVQLADGEASLTVAVENGKDSILIGLSASATAGKAYEFTAVDTTGLLVIAL
ncbi:MAG: hypothetical protein J6M26_06725, partial [Clostridia bacterium]|nr:hypothetical protein [Clostridia bacterium]